MSIDDRILQSDLFETIKKKYPEGYAGWLDNDINMYCPEVEIFNALDTSLPYIHYMVHEDHLCDLINILEKAKIICNSDQYDRRISDLLKMKNYVEEKDRRHEEYQANCGVITVPINYVSHTPKGKETKKGC